MSRIFYKTRQNSRRARIKCGILRAMKTTVNIGPMVKYWRNRRGMSGALLAERSGISRQTLWNIEHGRHDPALGSVISIADALEVDVEDLIHDRT